MDEALQNELLDTQDGSHTLLSKKFGVSYHSKYGAIKESQHVFIDAGLKARMLRDKEPISILECGFGTGLNALLAYLCAEQHQRIITYEGVEAFPITLEVASSLNYPQILQVPQAPFIKMHEVAWNQQQKLSSYFSFQKTLGKFEEQTYEHQFDVLFFDAFAPTAQPELWDLNLLSKAYKALRPGGVLVTYCAKGVVKRTLKAVGFRVETLPGPPGKREMTRGVK
jgi:tRNA U34 5-methylaminomethyl-2-thiouridine-forming methyltransferase MnmC